MIQAKKSTKKRPAKKTPKRHPKARPAKLAPEAQAALVEVYYQAYKALPDSVKEDLFIRLANEPMHAEDVVDIAAFLTHDPNEPTILYDDLRKELELAS